MYLWDTIEPPLPPGAYRLVSSAEARFEDPEGPPSGARAIEHLDTERFFSVDAPRFSLPPAEVAGVVPPRNAHGPFHMSLPHVVLGRRTLPWERTLDRSNPGTPWMALLLFEEDECKILDQQPLQDVVPPDVFARLGRPAGVLCDAVEVDRALLQEVMPSIEEVALLTHVRQVNVDDRELAAGDSDGWFAIVVANRLPAVGKSHVVCLVSIEERTDLVPGVPPPASSGEPLGPGGVIDVSVAPIMLPAERERGEAGPGRREAPSDALGAFTGVERTDTGAALVLDPSVDVVGHPGLGGLGGILAQPNDRLVLLHRWKFDCDGAGTFRQIMQELNVGMIGTVAEAGRPVVTDTGHIPLALHGRAGVDETVWYRGPLVPNQLSRDELGPYHSADQARRVTPETGAEDVSYAAAFEVGRLLAAADQRLGVELMRWRRGAYRSSARADVLRLVETRLPALLPRTLLDVLPQGLVPVIAAGVIDRVTRDIGPVADPYRAGLIANAPGLDPDLVQAAWRLPSRADAERLLNAGAGIDVLGSVIDAVDHPTSAETLDEAARDAAGIERLGETRSGRGGM